MSTPHEPGPSMQNSVAAKKRSPVERVIVWGGIVLMLGVLLIEYRAKTGYDTTISALLSLSDTNGDVTMEEARQKMTGFTSVNGPVPNADGQDVYTYRWFSILKWGTYEVSLTSSKDKRLLRTFNGPAFAEDPDVVAARAADSNADYPDAPPPTIGGALANDPVRSEPAAAASPATGETAPASNAADSAPPTDSKDGPVPVN